MQSNPAIGQTVYHKQDKSRCIPGIVEYWLPNGIVQVIWKDKLHTHGQYDPKDLNY